MNNTEKEIIRKTIQQLQQLINEPEEPTNQTGKTKQPSKQQTNGKDNGNGKTETITALILGINEKSIDIKETNGDKHAFIPIKCIQNFEKLKENEEQEIQFAYTSWFKEIKWLFPKKVQDEE